jgi:hypothetical protein
MDPVSEGIQITPGTSLNTVITNNVDATVTSTPETSIGLITYIAGDLTAPFPNGTFTVATIRFNAYTITPDTLISFLYETAVTDGINDVTGTLVPAIVQVVAVPVPVSIALSLQGGLRPASGWGIPLRIAFYYSPAEAQGGPCLLAIRPPITAPPYSPPIIVNIAPGIYDIYAVSEHTLGNIKRNVVVNPPSVSISLGTLFEGDADWNGIINIQDFGLLAASYGKSKGNAAYNPMADFDRNDIVNIFDFGLLATNYLKMGPIEVP